MSSLKESLQANLALVNERITQAAAETRRFTQAVELLAVSKNFPAEAVLELARLGQKSFGENYVQEALDKMDRLAVLAPDLRLDWRFIGPIQSNKTRALAERFDWVESVDRTHIAERLSAQRPAALSPLNVLLQVNISGEASKSGLAAGDVASAARAVAALPRLRLRGLMAIPAAQPDPALARAPFAQMRELFEELRADGIALDTLSMGMSDDLGAAIAEGSTQVRIGTALFGQRPRKAA